MLSENLSNNWNVFEVLSRNRNKSSNYNVLPIIMNRSHTRRSYIGTSVNLMQLQYMLISVRTQSQEQTRTILLKFINHLYISQ